MRVIAVHDGVHGRVVMAENVVVTDQDAVHVLLHPLEDFDSRREINLRGQVIAHPAGLALELIQRETAVLALIPGLHVEVAVEGVAPQVEMLGLVDELLVRRLHGVAELLGEILGKNRDSEVRVGLALRVGGLPVVALIGGVHDAEERIVFDQAVEELLAVLLGQVAGAGGIGSRSRDVDGQALAAGSHAGDHRVMQVAAWMLVVFVDNGAARRRAVPRIADQRLKFAIIAPGDDGLDVDLQVKVLFEARGLLGHAARRAKDLHRLFFVGGSRKDLGARLVIGHQHVEADAGRPGGLRILAGHLDVGLGEAPEAGLFRDPAEDAAGDKDLPWFELDESALTDTGSGPLAFDVRQQLDEAADPAGARGVEAVRVILPGRLLQVSQMALAGFQHPFAGEKLFGNHIARIAMADGGKMPISLRQS